MNLPIALFVDDERFPPSDGKNWHIVRSSQEALTFCKHHGVPSYMSLDHDLGLKSNGKKDDVMDFLHALIEGELDGELTFPDDFAYVVHSQNPVGLKNIQGLLDSYLKHRQSVVGLPQASSSFLKNKP